MADVNGDGRADIVGFGKDGVYTALGKQDGSFRKATLAHQGFSRASGWKNNKRTPRYVDDVNGDGRADIVGFGSDGVYTALGKKNGTFGKAKRVQTDFTNANGWKNHSRTPRQVVDVNGDGRADIVGFGPDGVYTALGKKNGGFRTATVAQTDFTKANGWTNAKRQPRQVVDINGDGRADIIGANQSGISIAYGQADGSFSTAEVIIPPTNGGTSFNPNQPQVADINGDGLADRIELSANGVVVTLGSTEPTPPAVAPPTPPINQSFATSTSPSAQTAPPPPYTAPTPTAPPSASTPSTSPPLPTYLTEAEFQSLVPTGSTQFVLHQKPSFDTTANTYVITHGWRNNVDDDKWIRQMADDVLLNDPSANVILTNWKTNAETSNDLFGYEKSVNSTPEVGRSLAIFLSELRVNPAKVQLIGHSLGAHISGIAGSTYKALEKEPGSEIGMIVGLDPAGPLYETTDGGFPFPLPAFAVPGIGPANRLDAGDAKRVVAIHTDEYRGFDARLGDVDIYVNENRKDLDTVYLGRGRNPGRSNDHNYAGVLYRDVLVGNSFGDNANVGGTFDYNDILDLAPGRYTADTVNKPVSIIRVKRFATGINIGTDGNDVLTGSVGNDDLRGGGGNDIIDGKDGNDILSGEDGNDVIYGRDGDDILDGGRGSDRLYGGYGNDQLWAQYSYMANTGGNILEGGFGNDTLNGHHGNDTLRGDQDNDALYGNEGDDFLNGGSGNDTIDGGNGTDTVSYRDAGAAVTVDLSQGTATSTEGDDTLVSVENVHGSAYDDILIGDLIGGFVNGYDHPVHTIHGGAGNDTIDGGDGNDLLIGGGGADKFVFDMAKILNLKQQGTTVGDATASWKEIADFNVAQGDSFEFKNIPAGQKISTLARPGTILLYLGDNANPLQAPFAEFKGLSAASSAAIQNQIAAMNRPPVTENPAPMMVLNGTDGDDVLIGGTGPHMLFGGAGADTFVLDMDVLLRNQFQNNRATTTAQYYDNYRLIKDFNVAEGDRIEIRNAPANSELFYQRLFGGGAVGKLTTRGAQAPDTTIFAEFETLPGLSEVELYANTPGVSLYFG